MSSSTPRKKNTRFYWAELGFLALGLFGINPNILSELLGGSQPTPAPRREPSRTSTSNNQSAVSNTIQSLASSLQTPVAILPPGVQQFNPGYPYGVGAPAQNMLQAYTYTPVQGPNGTNYLALYPVGYYGSTPYGAQYNNQQAYDQHQSPGPNWMADFLAGAFHYMNANQSSDGRNSSGNSNAFAQNQQGQYQSGQYQQYPNTVPPAEYPVSTHNNGHNSSDYSAQSPVDYRGPNTSMINGYNSSYHTVADDLQSFYQKGTQPNSSLRNDSQRTGNSMYPDSRAASLNTYPNQSPQAGYGSPQPNAYPSGSYNTDARGNGPSYDQTNNAYRAPGSSNYPNANYPNVTGLSGGASENYYGQSSTGRGGNPQPAPASNYPTTVQPSGRPSTAPSDSFGPSNQVPRNQIQPPASGSLYR